MRQPETAILHYTAPPVIGGVEAVIQAQTQMFSQVNYPVTIIAGRGKAEALPPEASFIQIPELDSQHLQILEISAKLEKGEVCPAFDDLVNHLIQMMRPILRRFDNVIIHNIFTKHFNLPLTAALSRLLQENRLQNWIGWCHDFTWTSPNSRSKVHPGYPWDLLRTYHQNITYVVVSKRRQQALAGLLNCPLEKIQVIYNGVDPQVLLGLSTTGYALVERLGLLSSDLVLLMPVRVTQAKNIEYALQLVAALKARGYRPKLIVTGPPDPHEAASMTYFKGLQALRRQLGIEEEMRFVFESGPDPAQPFFIEAQVVGELFRLSDVMFMPSHREGFGMPVLEAGLAGVPVLCTNVPVAEEIGGNHVIIFDIEQDPVQLAEQILDWAEQDAVYRLRRRVRQQYTWQAIFHRNIKPLIDGQGVS